MPDVLQIGESVQLTPDQIAQATPQVTPEVTPQVADPFPIGSQISLGPEQAAEARRQSGQLDPLQDFTAEQLAELQTQNPEFNLIQSYAPKTELQQRPGMHQKVADAYNLLRQKGTFGAQLDVKKVPGQLVDIAKGFGKQLWNYAQAFATPVGAMVADVAGADPATVSGMFAQGQRQIAENISGTEAGLAGLGHTTSAGFNWINRRLKLSKPLAELSPEERVANLQDAIHSAKQIQEISRGKGPIMSTVGDEVVKELETAGVPVRPEQVQELAAGDPFSWFLMGKAFHGLGAVVPPSVSAQAAKATQAAGNFAAKFGGKTIETAADVTKLGLDAAAAVSPVAGAITGAVKGGTLHGPVGLATGAALGYKGGQVIAGGLTKAGKTAERVSGIGEQIAGTKPIISPVAQIGKDVLQSAPAAAGDLAKGVGFDLALAGLTSEEAPEERAGLGIGAAFGVLGAGKRVGGRVLSGQIIAPREYGVNQVTPSSGQFPALDAMHTAAIQGAGPGIAARLNAIRLFAKGAAPGTDVFLAKDSPSMEAALTQVGMSPEQAKAYAAQQGFFTTSLPGRDGSTRKVIVARDVSAAPHEAFHAIQDVLGENENLAIDKIVQDAYAPRWEAEGETYARRLVGNEGIRTKTWREAILDASGWGRAEAADKLAMDAANRIRTATGAEPKASDVAALAKGEWASMLADAAKRNPTIPVEELQNSLWRDILNPQEAQEVGDRYIARELAAENFDAVFKHGSGGDAGVIPKLSRIVANVVSTLGGEPLAGRVSETGQVPLSYDVTQAVSAARPVVEPAQPKAPKPIIATTQGMPTTAEAQQRAAEEARQIAAEAPAVAPTPPPPAPGTSPGTSPGAPAAPPFVSKSPRELLGQIAEAIAGRSGVKINYSSAPGEPAAALTSTRPIRRSIIEAFRTMPESARALWEKSFFPERVIKTKSGYQVLGWAPEVFAANAHKMAQTMIDTGVASPYELNPATRSFSEKGWQDLFADVTTFVTNQGRGRTGSGEALVVPKTATDAGLHAPPTTGKGIPLEQRNADFINMLFHFKLPETPRVTSGKLPLNIAGQEISAATMPGRVESPVQPKQPYTGAAAQKLGIEGREILEVNPVRREIEAAAAAKNIPMPSLIEAVQRLDLAHIKEVQVTPELQQFRGNTLTLTAGFQPSAHPDAIKAAAVRDRKTGEVFEGFAHFDAQSKADQSKSREDFVDGFTTNKGEFLDRDAALKRAIEQKQLEPGARVDEGESLHSGDMNFPEGRFMQFQPSAEPKGVKQAAIRDENGKIYEGESHAHATFAALQERRPTQKNQNAMDAVLRHPWSTEGFVTNEGEFLNRQEAMRRAVEMNQYTPTPNEAQLLADPASRLQPGLESTSFAHQQRLAEAGYPRDASQPRFSDLQSQFSPAIEGVEKLKDKTFWDGLKTFTGKYGGGITGYAYEIGSAAKSEADLSAFRSAYDTYGTMGKEAMRNKDYNTASDLLSKAQVAREAFEVATGQKIDGTAGEAGSLKQLRAKDPSYTPLLSRAPEPAQFQPNPKNPAAEELAKDYAKEKGFEPPVPSTNRQLPSKLMQELGDYFEDAPHAPADPATKASYGAMLSQMKDQADKILSSGIDVEPWTGKGEPYPNSRAMTEDVMKNNHLYFLKTTGGFGGAPAGGENLSPENLMRAPSGISRHGYDLDMNEVTRFVHDYFGHTAEGNQFGPRGEFNAFLKHAQLFTPEAQKALTAELLMQAGWFFNGRHIRREDGTVPVKGEPDYIPPENRPFIEPKNLLPSEELFQRVQDEVNAVRGQAQPQREERGEEGQFAPKQADKGFKLKPASSGFSKAWIFPDGSPMQIGGLWHNKWLDENAAVRKQYGFKTEPDATDGDIRTEALQKGFARINYDARSGTMTLEARERDWPTIAPAFEKFIKANLPQIDKVQVYQYNDAVDAIADSGFANLFPLRTKKEKLAAVPFLSAPGEVVNVSPQATPGILSEQAAPGAMPRRGPAQFQPFASKELDKELEAIRSGQSGGQTFTPEGTVWNPKDKAVDIVSLASVNVPQGDLNPVTFRNAVAPYVEVLTEPGIVAGVFSFSKDGKPTVSIDINAVVPQKYRENSLAFAKANEQREIWDVQKGEGVISGGSGNPKLSLPDEILDAYDSLITGKPVSISDIQKQHRTPEDIARQQYFSEIGGAEPLSSQQIANMTKAEMAEQFPEAIIPRRKSQLIGSDIVNSPLAKAAKSEDAAVDAFARKLVEFARENADRPEYKLGERWYRDFVPQLKKEFGKDSEIFAELLAATSPNTGVTTNFGYAYDALQGLRSGRFKKIVPKFEEGLRKIADESWQPWLTREVKAGNAEGDTPAAFLARWIDKYDLKPRQSNGSLYGQHSIPVLQVFARQWVDRNTGPKTKNFLRNLLGTGHDATIDVWADRTMRRLGYSGFADRWRILPQNSTGVSDPDFHFSQKAFSAAADQLGIKADDLQGALWFAEKKHWADNGWGRLDLGSFQKEMDKIPLLKAGIQQRLKTTEAKTKSPTAEPQELFSVQPRKLRDESTGY